ncbi:DUF3846 domain-containing protein [Agromyces protaetiae]|uniref:DUF3846 domain-containing protein n=1 Tax=Agromyces protaetiae TaxID=2509455 RepID=A0A4V0YHC6_9MICO|nr:DUF3846 domain-containing protein [Agromyces protaetiae]QAY74241.1 DUF3846 domain-containing protein [Agromyces protaetiae]
MVKALRIPADESEPITELEVSKLEDYQAVVGGWIEPVDVAELGVTIYVHEEGLVLDLLFNSRATLLWWYFVPESRQKAVLVGPALIVGLPDSGGDSTDIPTHVAEMLADAGIWRVEAHVPGIDQWYANQRTYDDYFEALVYAMVILERWEEIDDIRVVPAPPDSGEALAGGVIPTEPVA